MKIPSLPIKYFKYLFIILFVPLIWSCNDDDDDDDDDDNPSQPTPVLIDFGATYGIMDGQSAGGVDLPVLAGDSLYVRVGYSGCEANHEFQFRSRILGENVAEVWYEKITPDEDCQAFFAIDKVDRVPFDVLARKEIYLVGPNFYTFQLR
jgi:hypothetical protein